MKMKSGIAMGAERCLLAGAFAFLLYGCGDTSQSPENPTILGTPPSTAYLGVDYNYNFGAAGGDNLLDFSLSNAPSWLALEETTNSARPGIVLRGVPGRTGGDRGESDLGRYENIRITGTDGNILGDGGFEIQVRHNPLQLENITVQEGRPFTPSVDPNQEDVCEFPDMDESPIVEVTHKNLAVGDDDDFNMASREYRAFPILIPVRLEQPSVEPVKVRFRITEETPRQDVDGCAGDDDRPCEYESRNRSRAIYGEDFALHDPDVFSAPPEYLDYRVETPLSQQFSETEGKGVLTFEPGITTCFIRAWVFDDHFAERDENFLVELEEVTEGLATVDGVGASSARRVTIEDNAPELELKPAETVITRNVPTEFTALLDSPNSTGETLYSALLVNDLDLVLEEGDPDYEIKLSFKGQEETFRFSADDDHIENVPLHIYFAPGEQEVQFEVTVLADSGEPQREEESFEVISDQDRQFGRENFVRHADQSTEVYINDWIDEVSFVLNDPVMVVGDFGELYYAGMDGNELNIRSINRLGSQDESDPDTANLVPGEEQFTNTSAQSAPRLAFASVNTGTRNDPERRRYLAFGYTSEAENIELGLFRSILDDEDEEGEKELQWLYSPRQQGGGNAELRDLDFRSSDRLVFGGMADGNWETPEGTRTAAGDFDILVGQIESSGSADEEESADLQWTNLVGTPLEDQLIGLDVGGTAIRAVGWTLGDLVPDDALGGADFFDLSFSPADGELTGEGQSGTDDDDKWTTIAAGSGLVLGGTGRRLYETDEFNIIDPESPTTESGEADNPFVMMLGATNRVNAIANLGQSGSPVARELTALARSGSTIIAGGKSDGDSGAFLSLLNREGGELEEEWRMALEGAVSIAGLNIHEGRKIFVLLEDGNGQYRVRLFNLQGNQLTQ